MTSTSEYPRSQTQHDVIIDMQGTSGSSGQQVLHTDRTFRSGSSDTFVVSVTTDLGKLQTLTVSLCASCSNAWRFDNIEVTNLENGEVYTFLGGGQLVGSRDVQSLVLSPGEEKCFHCFTPIVITTYSE